MKLLLSIAAIVLFAGSAFAAITQVQSVANDTGTATGPSSLTLTFGAATTAGNLVVVVLHGRSNTFKVTSTHSSFRQISNIGINGNNGRESAIYYAVMFGADTVFTITNMAGANAPFAAVAVEYSGKDIRPDDVVSSPNSSSIGTSTPTTGALTNVTANALLVGCIGQQGFNSATENTSWASSPSSPFAITAQITTKVNSGGVDVAVAYLEAIVTTTAARTASATSALGTLNSAGLLASFREIDCSVTCPTPTATPTATATNTPTPTPTATATASFTPCAPTPTATATFTPTATASATYTPTPTKPPETSHTID